MKDLHLVLGGAGAIGQAVITELQSKGLNVKAVERSKQLDDVETINVDLMNSDETKSALEGSTHVYLCVGLPYNSKIWEESWPKLARSVIDASAHNNAKLIFFDNMYMYGPSPLTVPFDEKELQEPQSKKGEVRKIVADMILAAHKDNKIKAVIGRSADFYGPNAINSTLYATMIKRMLDNKKPQWVGKAGVKHTWAYSLDNGRALVELALDNSTYGEVWHLPVGPEVTPNELLGNINQELGSDFSISYMPKPVLTLLSLFVPILRELKETLYQFDNTYHMSWNKFHTKFPEFKSTGYDQGIREMIKSFKKG